MLTLPSGAILEFETFLRSFLRALDALTYDIRNIPCSSNMRNFSRAANIGICNFPGFSQGQNAVIDSLRSISKTAYCCHLHESLLFKSSTCCFLPTSRSIRNLPRAATKDQRTKRPEDQGTRGPKDQGTRTPGDQRTRGPEDQRMRGPEPQRLGAGSTGPKDQGASPNSKAQAEPTLGKKNLGPPKSLNPKPYRVSPI